MEKNLFRLELGVYSYYLTTFTTFTTFKKGGAKDFAQLFLKVDMVPKILLNFF